MNKSYLKSGGLFSLTAIAMITACEYAPANEPKQSKSIPTSAVSNKEIESSGVLFINALSRSQQAYFMEKNKFSPTIDYSGTGIKAEDSKYYKLAIVSLQPKQVVMSATAKQDDVKSFSASVFVINNAGMKTLMSIVCSTDAPSKTPPIGVAPPQSGVLTCPIGSSVIN